MVAKYLLKLKGYKSYLVLLPILFVCFQYSNAQTLNEGKNKERFAEETIHQAFSFYSTEELHHEFARQTETSIELARAYLFELERTGRLSFNEYFDLVEKGNITHDNARQYWMNKLPALIFRFKEEKENFIARNEEQTVFVPYTGGAICNNLDFYTGNSQGWSGRWNNTGMNQWGTAPLALPAVGINSSGTNNSMNFVHEICTAGTDPHFPVQRVPPGHTYSLRLGNDSPESGKFTFNHQMIENTFTVTTANNTLVYWYAVMFSQRAIGAPHTELEQPYFKIRMFDQSGNEIICAHYDVNVSTGASSGFDSLILANTGVKGFYRNWQQVMIPLINYIGQKVTIRFESSDCDLGGHFGYAYLTVDCGPFQVIQADPFPCNGGTVSLTAPAGAATYSWTGPGIVGASNTQQISANSPGNYEVTMTTLGNSGNTCTFKIDTVLTHAADIPVAAFSLNSGCIGLPTIFTNNSTGTGLTYSWDFGDNTPLSTVQNPTHTYALANTYTVTLIVKNAAGCLDTITQTVIISPKPKADFTVSAECLGAATTFTNSSTPATGLTYNWNFGVPGGLSTQQSPTHTYTTAGNYTASLVVSTASGCKDSIKVPVVVNPNAVPKFTVADVCEGETTVFNNLTPTSPTVATWAWDYNNDGTVDNTTMSPSTTLTPGSYMATLTVTTATTPACTAFVAVPFKINPKPVPKFTATRVCQGTPTVFNTTASTIMAPGKIMQYDWTFGDNTTGTGDSPQHIYPGCGKYPVTLKVTSDGNCIASYSDTIYVKCIPTANFTAINVCLNQPTVFTNTSSISSGNVVKFDWDFNKDGTIDNSTKDPTYTYTAAGIYNVNLIVSSDSGCTNSLTLPVTVHPLPVVKFSASHSCLGTPVVFTDLSTVNPGNISTWSWDFDNNGTVDNTTVSPTYTYTTIGTQQVHLTVTTNNQCKGDITLPIFINPNPSPLITLDDPDGCPIHPVNLSGAVEASSISHPNSIVKWEWDYTNDGVVDVTHNYLPGKDTDAANAEYNNTGHQNPAFYAVSLTVTSDSGCVGKIASPSNFITVFPTPVAEFSWGPSEPRPDIFTPTIYFYNQAIGASSWFWNFGDINSSQAENSSTLPNPTHTYAAWKDGTYNVWQYIQNTYGCKDSIMHPIEILPNWTFYIPNAFTPTGDEINDGFRGTGMNIHDYTIWIFDRWGNLVFTSHDLDEYWNGKMHGNLVQEDVFVWKVKFKDVFDGKHERHGIVTVVR